MEHRNAARDGGLEQEARAMLPRKLHERRAMLGDELLVGRDDAFPRLQGARAVFQRRAAAADRLDKDRDLRVGLDHGKVPHHFLFKRVAWKISPDKNVFEFDRLSGAFGDFRGIAAKDLRHTAADRSVARNGDLLHIFFPQWFASR